MRLHFPGAGGGRLAVEEIGRTKGMHLLGETANETVC